MFEEALKEMKAGRSLCDTAAAFNIPRTTLYMRARSTGIISIAHKLSYTKEQLEEAINAVKGELLTLDLSSLGRCELNNQMVLL